MDTAASNPYMGAPVEVVTAPNGAIGNRRIIENADKVAYLERTVESPVPGVFVFGGFGLAPTAVIEAEENLQTLRQMADAERRRKLALMAAEQEAEANATRVRINAEADKIAAEARGVIGKKEAETQQIKAEAEAKGFAARIAAEKITGISINHVSGLGKSSGDAPASPVNQTVESILDMAVNLPAMQRLGEQIGLSLDATLAQSKTSSRKKDS